MAILLKNYKLSNGLISDKAYLKVCFLSGNKNNMTIMVKGYISKEASDAGVDPIDEFSDVFIPDVSDFSANYHKQAYEYLKKSPKFEYAIDVFE